MSRNMTVKLSPYEQAINRLNDLPVKLDRVFSDALEDLRRQRDEARAEVERLRGAVEELRNAFIRDADVAERQREACAVFIETSNEQASDMERDDLDSVALCRATPLVTEGDE